MERQSRNVYGIWAGGRYATHQDVAGLFYARSVDLYLKDGGMIGMVMPHSALQTGQYSRWRTGSWTTAQGLSTISVDFGHKTAWDLERLEPNTFFPIPASVVFAKRLGSAEKGTPLTGNVHRWEGVAGAANVRRVDVPITDTSVVGDSPYADRSRQGASIVPRCLFFVEETENPAIIQAGQTITVNPRRGSWDKEPWRSLYLTAITGQTIEKQHVFDIHLGETIVPYATLPPLKAILPLKSDDAHLATDDSQPSGIRLGELARRMRDRWQTIYDLWEENKAAANRLDLLGQLDYYGKLSAQLEWRQSPAHRLMRVVYSGSGEPTAALLRENETLIDYTLFWIPCRNLQEANYLLALINSDALYSTVSSLMPKGQFGARHLQKHLWKLPIPAFDPLNQTHTAVARAGKAAADGAARQLARLQQERGDVTSRIGRREVRGWLRSSRHGKAVEEAVARLLDNGL